jgi:hypothetical protein
MMNDKEYIEHGGARCPNCRGKKIEGDGALQSDAGCVWQEIKCTECDSTWQDVYELTGYDKLINPDETVKVQYCQGCQKRQKFDTGTTSDKCWICGHEKPIAQEEPCKDK